MVTRIAGTVAEEPRENFLTYSDNPDIGKKRERSEFELNLEIANHVLQRAFLFTRSVSAELAIVPILSFVLGNC